jgi:hypothetical protein
METYTAFLGLITLTALAVLIIAGAGFLLFAMWIGVKDRIREL